MCDRQSRESTVPRQDIKCRGEKKHIRRFRLDEEAISEFAQVHAISAQTIDPDFERNPRIHRAWELRHLDQSGRSGRESIKLDP